jgi:hypothetical protein
LHIYLFIYLLCCWHLAQLYILSNYNL